MRANHIPTAERLRTRIDRLEYRYERGHVPTEEDSNPYWMCADCGITDPAISCNENKHYKHCSRVGLLKEVAHYKRLLAAL